MLLVIFLLQLPVSAEIRTGQWLRRGATAALCATSAMDGLQTANAVHRPGIYEANSLFRARGGVNLPLVIGTKALVCAGALVMGERLPAHHIGYFTGLNLAGAGINSLVILHNRQVARAAGIAK